jgi:hypothetical protein
MPLHPARRALARNKRKGAVKSIGSGNFYATGTRKMKKSIRLKKRSR